MEKLYRVTIRRLDGELVWSVVYKCWTSHRAALKALGSMPDTIYGDFSMDVSELFNGEVGLEL